MTKINRRKIITLIGSFTVGGLITAENTIRSRALDLTVNSFDVENDIYLEDIDTLLISIKDMSIEAQNIDDSKDVKLSVYASIENNNVGKIETRTINITENATTIGPYDFDIKNGSKYKSEYLTIDPYIDQNNIEVTVKFELEHPSIDQTITEFSSFIIGFADGEFLSNSYPKASSKDLTTNGEQYKSIMANDLSVWNEDDRFTKLKIVLKGGQPTNKSSYSLPKGVIDVEKSEFPVSPRNSNEIKLKEPESSKYDIV